MPRLIESLERAPVIRVKDYDYFVHPLTDGVQRVEPALLDEVTEGLRSLLPPRFDVLLAPEAMGLPIVAALSLATRKPFLIARKRAYGLPGEIVAPYATGYSDGKLHVNGLRPNDQVVIVDDVLSRGGTLRALAAAIRQSGATLTKTILLVDKGRDLEALAKEIGSPIEALVQIEVRGGRVQVLQPHATPRLPT